MANSEEIRPRTYRTEWSDLSGVEPIFVDELGFQVIRDNCHVVLGQTRFPLITPETPLEKVVTAEIRPMARLVIPVEAMRRMLDALNKAMNMETSK